MLKKLMSFVLITGLAAIQLGFAGTTTPTESPEMTLLQSTLALEGQNLPQAEMKTQFANLITNYASTAPTTGQQDRMEQALVTLNMYTPAQAHQLMSDVETSSQTLTTTKFASETALTAQTSAEISRLATAYPAGAQFSACDTGDNLLMVGGTGLAVGAVIWALSSAENGPAALKSAAEGLTAAGAAGVMIGVILLATQGDGC